MLVWHDRVSVIITLILFLLLPAGTAFAASAQNPLFPVEFPAGSWISLIERQEWGIRPSKCIKSCERAQRETKGMLDEGVEEREKRERGERNHASSGSGLRPAALVPRGSSIITHTLAACCCPFTGLLTPSTSSTCTLIDLYKKGQWAQVTVIYSFFSLSMWHENCPVSRCCDSCDPGCQDTVCDFTVLWMFDAFELVSYRMHT